MRLAQPLFALLALVLFAGAALAGQPVPPLTGRVVDHADIIDPDTAGRIAAELEHFEEQKQIQLVVVTLPDLAGYTIEDWGLALGRGWSIGQKGRNNGVLLLVAPKDRELRIEVGYGLEGDLPDATANRIIQSIIIPEFRAANMPLGIEAGVQAIIKTLGGEIQGNAIAPPASGDASGGALPAAAIFFIFFAFMAIMNMRRRRSGPWGGGYYPYGYGGGGFGRGGGFSGRSSSNGGFSGGGGSFGGGGASGRW